MTASPFTITPTPPTSVTLKPGQDGTFSFTVTCLAAPDKRYAVMFQAVLVGADGKPGDADWLAVAGESTRTMAGGDTQAVVITAKPIAATPVGRHAIELAVADKDRPYDTFAYSAPVACEIEPQAIDGGGTTRKLPWWLIAAIAVGGILVGGALVKLLSGGDHPTVADAKVPDAAIPDATSPDAPVTDAAMPKPFAPLHVQSVMPDAPDLILSKPVLINTTFHTIDDATSPFFVQQGDYAVLFARMFSVRNLLLVRGTFPLVIVASDRVEVVADVDLAGGGAGAAPAGHPGAGGAGGAALDPSGSQVVCAGGGGGSYGSVGAPGGSSWTKAPAGTGGQVYGTRASDPLIGGAPGGNGGHGHGGGLGGGALQISSAVSINIIASINAGGGEGGGGRLDEAGGGGGGAGGEILLEAPAITVSGILAANGGGGGGGGAGARGVAGGDGNRGAPGLGVAAGGAAGQPFGSRGGDGAAGATGAFVEATPGSNLNHLHGGGGGGAGRIWLRYRAATPPNTSRGQISPPPGMDPTLP